MICPRCGQSIHAGVAVHDAEDSTRLAVSTAVSAGRGLPDPDATTLGYELPALDPDATRPGFISPESDPDATAPGVVSPPDRPSNAQPELAPPVAPAAPRITSARRDVDAASDLVGKPLGPRYQIQKLLGAGGMGAVYSAWDRELGIAVALKTVRPEVTADPETARALEQRFKQELLLARQVTHKNIVRVYDMGEVDGIKYITMPYLAGADLAGILDAEGKLSVRRVMRIARQVASGLAAAHEAGVVHRDLKPANIMIQATGEALIMDFGIALSTGGPKSIAKSGPNGKVHVQTSAGQTVAGSVVGTIQYMAPEQARAEPIDQRADIYAFGLILYDLLLGRTRSTRADSLIAELNLRMTEPLPTPRSVDPDIPEALDRIITRCIQINATARYATTADLIADIEQLDDEGSPLPATRRFTWRMGVAAAAVLASLVGLTWWLARGPAAPVQHEPVSVVIADFENGTGEATFERTLEPMLKLALEGAGFISAYDRIGISRSLGVRPPEKLDEQAATELAVKQGLGIVLSGSVVRDGFRYAVSMKATQAVTGQVITSATQRASNKDQVLAAATDLATSVREALGDEDATGSAQRFAMETLSATSLEVVREYATAMEALSRSKFDEALQGFRKAVALDPNFGLAYAGLAIASRNLDKQQDAEKYVQEALGHLDGMTDRERLRTRGLYYFITSDYKACVQEYGDLIASYAADAAARNNLALCQTYLRMLPQAVKEMRQVVKILPNRALYRENLALYASYSGDFQAAEQEARAMAEPGLFGLLALAFAQVGQGQLQPATQTYLSLGNVDEQGASYTASGLGDLAMYEGRYTDAVQILTGGATADLKAEDLDRAAMKFAALGQAQLLRGQNAAAMIAADRALSTSTSVKTRFLAGRIFAEAGAAAKARAIAADLSSSLQGEPQAYGKIIDGMLALKAQDARRAVQFLTEANALLDTWIGHFELGRAYLMAGAFPQADSEFERCIKRKGEALSLFLDEEPTAAFFPPVYYYQGRVREGLKSAKAAESYGAYVQIRGKSTEDPLLAEARRRAAVR